MKDYIIKSKQTKHHNSVGNVIEKIGIVTIIGGIIIGLIAGSDFYGTTQIFIVLAWWIGGVISAIFLFGFAEILHLLESIKNQSFIVTEYTEEEKLKDQESQSLSDEQIEEILEEEITEE